jgi:hypothetical protein
MDEVQEVNNCINQQEINKQILMTMKQNVHNVFFFFGATAPVWALAYLHETLRFTSVF